jgi:hypothetical protein
MMDEEKQARKQRKKEAKKARLKSEARTKVRMEIIRTCGSAGSFVLAALGFLHAYHFV